MKWLLFPILFFVVAGHAQTVTNAGGGSAAVGDWLIDWSIGELTRIDAPQIGNLWVSQGLLQPQLGIFTESGQTISAAELKILPNPTYGELQIWAGFLNPGKLSLFLYDNNGRLLRQLEENYTGFSIYIMDCSRFAAASYVLQAFWEQADASRRKSVFRILKL